MVALCAVHVQALVPLVLSARATASMRSIPIPASLVEAAQELVLPELSLRAKPTDIKMLKNRFLSWGSVFSLLNIDLKPCIIVDGGIRILGAWYI